MAKIRKIYDETIKPNGEKTVIYPITSTRAVYTPTSVTIDSLLNEGYRFGGIVLPTDSPSITDQRVFYGASVPGNYANFGGINVDGGEAIFFMWDGTTWHKGIFGGAGSNNLTGFKSLASIIDLPNEPTMYGYLIDDYMYVWVGENGDTLSGTYQNVGQLRGASAYEVAVRNGYEGTEQQWLADPINGIKGVSVTSVTEVGPHSDANSAENTYRITLSNNESLDMRVKNGKGINSVAIVGNYSALEGATNTYRITLSDNTVFEFQVINGSQGNTGSSIDYPFELLNVLNSTATDKGVTALKVKELNESAAHIGTTLNLADTDIKHISDFEGTPINPVTHERGVLDDNGNSIEPKLQHAQDLDDGIVTTTSYDNTAMADMTKYSFYIVADTGKYNTDNTYKHLRIDVEPGDYVYVTANSESNAGISFLRRSETATSGGTVYYATGWDNRVSVDAGKTQRFIAPNNAILLYVYAGTSGTSYRGIPASVVVRHANVVTKKTPMMTLSVIGGGQELLKRYIDGVIEGHTYRVHIKALPHEFTTLSSAYIYFGIYSSDGSTNTMLVGVYMETAMQPYYDFVVPTGSTSIYIATRITIGDEGIFEIEDITSMTVENTNKGDIISANAFGFPEKSGVSLKDITGEITYTAVELENSFTRVPDGQIMVSNTGSSYIYGYNLANAIRTTGPDASKYHNIRIPLTNVVVVEFRQYGTSSNYGSVMVDSEDKIVGVMGTQGVLNQTTAGNISVGVPENAAYLIYSYNIMMASSYVTLKYGKPDADITNSIDALENEIDDEGISYAGYRDLIMRNSGAYVYRLQEMYNLESISVGSNISDLVFRSSGEEARWPCVMIPVDGFNTIECYWKSKESSSHRGSVFLDENMDVTGKIQYTTGQRAERQIPAGTKYLLYNVSTYDDSNNYIRLKKEATISSRLNALESEVGAGSSSNSMSTGMTPGLSVGKISSAGILDGDAKYMTTEPLFGNFRLEVGDGYVIYGGSLFDRQGNMVSYNHNIQMSNVTETTPIWSPRKAFSSLNMPSDYGYRLVIAKTDSSNFSDGERPVTVYVNMKDAPVTRWIPDDLPNYNIAQLRINYMQRALWTPLVKVHNSSTKNSEVDKAFCLAGNLMTNLPYSDLGATRKYVPINVSMRTFLTATKNKRSLLYTEDLFDNVSKYGISYSSTYRCGSYYGCACNAFTAWVMNMTTTYQSGDYNSNTVPGLSTVSHASASNVRPLDLIWNDGHISIISDIFKDEYGDVKYIVWAEMTTPYCKRTIYTVDQFEARLADRSCVVHRWNGWDTIPAPMDIPGYNPHELGGAHQDIPYCEDIMCFAGDYAAFATGDTIALNARRNSTYTGCKLYKLVDSEYSLLQTIDISEYPADGIYNDDEDWVVVDLTTLNPSAGKYRACLTDGSNDTGYTYFEVIGVTLSATNSGSSITATFEVTGGTPVSLEKCSNAGFIGYAHRITAEQASAGSVTKIWTYSSSYPKLYLVVAGDYGNVIKVIPFPQAS